MSLLRTALKGSVWEVGRREKHEKWSSLFITCGEGKGEFGCVTIKFTDPL